MRRETRIFICALIAALLVGLSACVTSQTETAGAPVASPPTPTPTLTPSSIGSNGIASNDPDYMPITLPVLDAFFVDETFQAELKDRVGLSDEQISVTPVVATTPGAPLPNAVPTDTRIVINAPAYRMDIFENGALVKSYRIGIGYPEFPLPAGTRTAKAIIFNPTWTPPDEPWVESPSSKVKVGQKVAAGSGLNPLGLVKVPIGLPSLIHGGKSPAQLGGFASHGCVGLTNAQVIDLSKRLAEIGGVELTDNQIAKYRRMRTETKNIALQQPIPVELRYETIVVEDGKLYIYRDVYERGTNTEVNLRNVLVAHGVTLENLSDSERSQVMDVLDQMGRNASGKAVPAAATTPFAEGATGPSLDPTSLKRRHENSTGGKLTRRVKGEKEMVIEIAALAGKGYSAPVELDTGKEGRRVATKGQAPAPARKQQF